MQIMSFLPKLLVAAALTAAGCGGGVQSGFVRDLASDDLVLPRTVTVDDFRKACLKISVTDPHDLIRSLGVKVHGSGDTAYMHTPDLIRACGPECNRDAGLGELLEQFAIHDQNTH